MKACVLLCFFCVTACLQAQTVSVGWDNDCDYDVRNDANAINTAISAGNSEIRLSNSNDYLSGIRIEDSVVLKGGYANCAAANAGTLSATRSRIDATAVLPSALKIYSGGSAALVSISGFTIENATGSQDGGPDFNAAAGFSIVETVGTITLTNVLINNNHSEFWAGGLAIRNDLGSPLGQSLQVNLIDTIISNNSGGNGGGFTCFSGSSPVSVAISGQSGISFNHSSTNGGGMTLDGCEVTVSSGTQNPGIGDPRGIHKNTADGDGGGAALQNGALLALTGTQLEPVNITENQADFDMAGGGNGGGLFLNGEVAEVQADKVQIADNFTHQNGGGVHAQFGAEFTLASDERGCSWNVLCGEVSGNLANNGGGFNAESGSTLSVSGMEAFGNRARSNGSLLSLSGSGNVAWFDSALIHHNGGSDQSTYFDQYLVRSLSGDSSISVQFSTIADNQVQYATISAYNGTSGTLSIEASIVDDPGIPPSEFVSPGAGGNVYCSIVNDSSGLTAIAGDLLFEQTPVFADRPNQDYHITAAANTALDQCLVADAETTGADLDGDIRGATDDPDAPNGDGVFDIGVDEHVAPDTELIFEDGFESS